MTNVAVTKSFSSLQDSPLPVSGKVKHCAGNVQERFGIPIEYLYLKAKHKMERVRDDDHPLSSRGRPPFLSISTTTSQGSYHQQRSNYRTPSASLIHSAVRSVLDDATPSSIVSDDRSEGESFVDGDLVTPKTASSPALESLQIERLPAIPDEQDRKRFIVSIDS